MPHLKLCDEVDNVIRLDASISRKVLGNVYTPSNWPTKPENKTKQVKKERQISRIAKQSMQLISRLIKFTRNDLINPIPI